MQSPHIHGRSTKRGGLFHPAKRSPLSRTPSSPHSRKPPSPAQVLKFRSYPKPWKTAPAFSHHAENQNMDRGHEQQSRGLFALLQFQRQNYEELVKASLQNAA